MSDGRVRAWASLGGLVFSVLAVIGAMLLFQGPSDSSPAKMAAYYGNASHRTHINIGWVLTGLATFALIWFIGAVRERVSTGEQTGGENGSFLSTIVVIGGTAYVAVAMVGIAIAGGIKTMSDDTYHHQVYSGVIHAAGDASYVLVTTAGAAIAAMIFATSAAALRFAILPRWVAWFGVAAGIAAVFSIFFFTMVFWILWIAVASVALFLRSRATTVTAREGEPVLT